MIQNKIVQHKQDEKRTQRKLLKAWLARLSSKSNAERQVALREFRDMPGDRQAALVELVYNSVEEQQETMRGWWMLFSVIFLFMTMRLFDLSVWQCTTISACVGWSISRFLSSSIEHETLYDVLDSCQGKEVVPFALTVLQPAYRKGIRPLHMLGGRSMRLAVLRLLPQVTEEDLPDWSRSEREALLAPLHRPFFDVELTIAVLRSLPTLGSEEAVRTVRRLASDRASYVDDYFDTLDHEANVTLVSEAAKECLPQLEALVERQKHAQTLLRASRENTTHEPSLLLRPTSPQTEAAPAEQLLRPQSE